MPILDFQVEDSHWKIVVNAFLRLRFHAIMVVVYGVMKRPKSEIQPCMIDFSKNIIMKFTDYFFFQNDYLPVQVVTTAFHHVFISFLKYTLKNHSLKLYLNCGLNSLQ